MDSKVCKIEQYINSSSFPRWKSLRTLTLDFLPF